MTSPVETQPSASPVRRALLRWIAFATGTLAAVAAAAPMIGYLLGPLRPTRIRWISLGRVDRFPLNETRLETFTNPIHQPWDGPTAKLGVYVRYQGPDVRRDEQFLVMAMNCTHLGCPVTWFAESGLFLCPCHGGVYYEDGRRASGPPPRGLYHVAWRVRRGRLEIRAPHLPTLHDTLRDEETA